MSTNKFKIRKILRKIPVAVGLTGQLTPEDASTSLPVHAPDVQSGTAIRVVDATPHTKEFGKSIPAKSVWRQSSSTTISKPFTPQEALKIVFPFLHVTRPSRKLI